MPTCPKNMSDNEIDILLVSETDVVNKSHLQISGYTNMQYTLKIILVVMIMEVQLL